MDRVARRGPPARAPGALKGDTSEIVNIFVAVEGGLFGEKTNFRKKSHNAEKLKGGPFGEKILGKKSHNAEKMKGGTLWGFSTSILSQNIKKLKDGKIFIFEKKSRSAKKK